MRLVQSWYEENFITNMGAFDIIDMGQTICLGLDGSYDGSVDAALSAVMTIYSVPPGRQGFVAVSAVEQAIRVSCRSYESTWTIWAGTEPFDPFAES